MLQVLTRDYIDDEDLTHRLEALFKVCVCMCVCVCVCECVCVCV